MCIHTKQISNTSTTTTTTTTPAPKPVANQSTQEKTTAVTKQAIAQSVVGGVQTGSTTRVFTHV